MRQYLLSTQRDIRLETKCAVASHLTGAYNDGKECLGMLELAFGNALKMKIIPGIILESKEVEDGNLSVCFEYGQKIARELTQ
jgi:hypothetical protein